ncbi:MAG: hypothetical protein ACI8T1_001122, partial [Verrucomicrobiales bacterium]
VIHLRWKTSRPSEEISVRNPAILSQSSVVLGLGNVDATLWNPFTSDDLCTIKIANDTSIIIHASLSHQGNHVLATTDFRGLHLCDLRSVTVVRDLVAH